MLRLVTVFSDPFKNKNSWSLFNSALVEWSTKPKCMNMCHCDFLHITQHAKLGLEKK